MGVTGDATLPLPEEESSGFDTPVVVVSAAGRAVGLPRMPGTGRMGRTLGLMGRTVFLTMVLEYIEARSHLDSPPPWVC